jgi:hypothetical protein
MFRISASSCDSNFQNKVGMTHIGRTREAENLGLRKEMEEDRWSLSGIYPWSTGLPP